MSDGRIHQGYSPGVIGRVAELHGRYYADHFGFGSFFEARVAADAGDYFRNYKQERDAFWAIFEGNQIIGSVAVDGPRRPEQGAQLRWFIVEESAQGRGVGKLLLNNAIQFCRQKGYHRIYLDTFHGLDVARHLYEQAGFRLVEERPGTQWGASVMEQRFELELDRAGEEQERE
jgi:GNAT superfamily N-acetyltransferase